MNDQNSLPDLHLVTWHLGILMFFVRFRESMRCFEDVKDRVRVQEQNFKDIAAKIQVS